MPKLSVYVPDELLDRARNADNSANTSQLVQRGLELVAGSDGRPVFIDEPLKIAPELLADIVRKLKPEATTSYREGFDLATQLAGNSLNWWVIDRLEKNGWDFDAWLRECDDEGSLSALVYQGAQGLVYTEPDSAWEAGIVDALRMIWNAVAAQDGETSFSSVTHRVTVDSDSSQELPSLPAPDLATTLLQQANQSVVTEIETSEEEPGTVIAITGRYERKPYRKLGPFLTSEGEFGTHDSEEVQDKMKSYFFLANGATRKRWFVPDDEALVKWVIAQQDVAAEEPQNGKNL